MKHFIIFSIIFSGLLLFSCQENPIEPQVGSDIQSSASLERAPLAKYKTPFTGTSNFVAIIDPGTTTVLPNGKSLIEGIRAEWYDEATDPRVTGKTFWYVNELLNEDGNGKYWGSAELIVDNNGGKWEIIWAGQLTNGGTVANATAFGTGVEGDVKGLTAKWDYKLDLAVGFFYKTKGFIIENNGPFAVNN